MAKENVSDQVCQLDTPALKELVTQYFEENPNATVGQAQGAICKLLRNRADEEGFEWIEIYDLLINSALQYSYLMSPPDPEERRIEFVYWLRKKARTTTTQAAKLAHWIAPIPKKKMSMATKAGILTAVVVFLFGIGFLIGRSF